MNSPTGNSLETRIQMARPHLDDWPAPALPSGFSIRPYQSGDSLHWRAIHERADPFNSFDDSTFAAKFGHDEEALQARQKYLLAPDGEVIGTATAWLDDPEVGRIHWVAIVPEYQGRGLARPLLGITGQTLRELGHKRVVLTTSLERPVAIALYQSLGFEIVEKKDF
jgi:predicted GNAT family acetyltransferase